MEFTVQNNNMHSVYSLRRLVGQDLSNGLYESVITLPITVWHIIEHKLDHFDKYFWGRVPITESQFGTHKMANEVAVVSGHHYPHA